MKDRFTMVLLAVLAITAVCGLASLIIAFTVANPTALMERAFNTLVGIFGVGAGAIFGLLGGNALAVPEPAKAVGTVVDGSQ